MKKINGICYSCEDLEVGDIVCIDYNSRTRVKKTTPTSIIDYEDVEWTEDEIDWEKSVFYGNTTDPKTYSFCEYSGLDPKGSITPKQFVIDNKGAFNAFCAGWNLGQCSEAL